MRKALKRTFAFCFFALFCWAAIAAERPVLVPKVCPTPVEAALSATDYVPLNEVSLACRDESAVGWAERHLKAWYGACAPRVTRIDGPLPEGAEAYRLQADASGVRIAAATLAGVRWAFQTLRQLAIPQRGTNRVKGWIVPAGRIDDRPALAFRGMHVCWFPETTEQQVERLIRLAGAYKMNYVVLEPWGTFESKVAPWYGWPNPPMTRAVLLRLRRVADDLGVTLIPQLNVFGHASMSRVASGKHAALDLNPEYQPYFEPVGGWNWCLSNPETRKLLVALIGELCEAFGNPPYFHLGCDEANPPSCPDCLKRPYSRILLEHVLAMNEAVVSLGARSMMWHDQLLERGDARWDGFYAFGTSETAAAVKDLPRNIVICDWYYGEEAKRDYPSLRYFKGLGFDVVTCPWQEKAGIAAQGAFACANGLFGLLGTTWNHAHGQYLPTIAVSTSCAAWGTPLNALDEPSHHVRFMGDLRRIGWDMKVRDAQQTGVYGRQVPAVSEMDE